MTDAAAIEASQLTKDVFSSFLRKRTRVLNGVDLRISSGETYGLLGLNGAGKTTTLKILLGLMRPTSGNVSVLGTKPGALSMRQKIGFLPENPYFYSHLSGVEFLHFVAGLFSMSEKEKRERAAELLSLVGLTDAQRKPMRQYSKGMLQRLGIAQSLLNNPQVVFWDEPMSGLDPIGRRDVRSILLKLKETGKTIFFNSHLLPDVSEVCDRIGVLHKGRIVSEERVATVCGGGGYRDLEEYFLSTIARCDTASDTAAAPVSAESPAGQRDPAAGGA